MEKKYKKLNWSKERKELFNRMSDWLEEIRKGEKTGFVWSMEQLLVFIEQEIDRAREEVLKELIKEYEVFDKKYNMNKTEELKHMITKLTK